MRFLKSEIPKKIFIFGNINYLICVMVEGIYYMIEDIGYIL